MAHWTGWGLACHLLQRPYAQPAEVLFASTAALAALSAAVCPCSPHPVRVYSLLNVQSLLREEHRAPTPALEH